MKFLPWTAELELLDDSGSWAQGQECLPDCVLHFGWRKGLEGLRRDRRYDLRSSARCCPRSENWKNLRPRFARKRETQDRKLPGDQGHLPHKPRSKCHLC